MRKQRAQEKIAIDTHKQEEEAQKKVAIAHTSTESTRENSYWHNAQRNKAQKKRITTAQKKRTEHKST